MQKLMSFLLSHYPLSENCQRHLADILELTEIKKRKVLLRPGQVCHRMYFIERGLLRGSKMLDGKESCLWFMKEGDLMTSVVSYYKQTPGTEYIYAMEDSRLWSVTKEQLDQVYRTYLELNFISRVLTEKYYVLDEEKLDMLRMKKAADRYDRFLQLYPGLDQRIAAKYIASYLTITMETLSRVKHQR